MVVRVPPPMARIAQFNEILRPSEDVEQAFGSMAQSLAKQADLLLENAVRNHRIRASSLPLGFVDCTSPSYDQLCLRFLASAHHARWSDMLVLTLSREHCQALRAAAGSWFTCEDMSGLVNHVTDLINQRWRSNATLCESIVRRIPSHSCNLSDTTNRGILTQLLMTRPTIMWRASARGVPVAMLDADMLLSPNARKPLRVMMDTSRYDFIAGWTASPLPVRATCKPTDFIKCVKGRASCSFRFPTTLHGAGANPAPYCMLPAPPYTVGPAFSAWPKLWLYHQLQQPGDVHSMFQRLLEATSFAPRADEGKPARALLEPYTQLSFMAR